MSSGTEKTDNYYDLLNVDRYATVEDIKKAYKKLVMILHPDVSNEDNSQERFKEIVKAYSVLRDTNLREEYDNSLDKGIKFFSKINFKYYLMELAKKSDGLWNTFKILFKDITDKKQFDFIEKNNFENDLLKPDIIIQNAVLEMPLKELEDRLLYSQNIYVRINACYAIGFKREKRSNNILEKLAINSEYELKKACIWAIGNLKMKKSIGFLKMLFNTTISSLRYDILKAVYMITDGKGSFLYNMFLLCMADNISEVRNGALNLFLQTNGKLYYKDIKNIINDSSLEKNQILHRLVSENRIINYSRESS